MTNPIGKVLLLLTLLPVLAIGCSNQQQTIILSTPTRNTRSAISSDTAETNLYSSYHDTLLGFSISYPANWTGDFSQPACCITVSSSTASSSVTVYGEDDYIQSNDIQTLDQLADTEQLTDRQSVRSVNALGVVGNAPVPNINGLIDYRREYIFMTAWRSAVIIDVSDCDASVQNKQCDGVARSITFDRP
jgi:hypothetical protein